MGTNNSSLQLTNIHDYIYLFLDKNLPPSTPVKKGATPKVSEVNVRDISVIESTPANLLKKSLLRKAMEGVEEEKVSMAHYLTHRHVTRLNLKKKVPLQFCLSIFLGIQRNPKQKDFSNSCEEFLIASLTGHSHAGPF